MKQAPPRRDLEAELARAREERRALADVLATIGQGSSDLRKTLQTILDSAARLASADSAALARVDGDDYEPTCVTGDQDAREAERFLNQGRSKVSSFEGRAPITRVAVTKKKLHIPDITKDQDTGRNLLAVNPQTRVRTLLIVPLLRTGELLGVISLRRHTVRPFTEDEITLVEAFADQAALALDNARLLSRTSESLEQQRAISDVLAAIGRATTDVHPVLDTILEHAVRLCGADRATVALREGDRMRVWAGLRIPEKAMKEMQNQPFPVNRESAVGRAVLEARTLAWDDITEDTELGERAQAVLHLSGSRSVLTVPLLKDGVALGAINLRRVEVRPFSAQEIALVETFAGQAVIAIENVRLFNETRESLERQTATANLLQVISRATSDLQPVFDTIVESAVRLCAADYATFWRPDGDVFVVVAGKSVDPSFLDFLRTTQVVPGRGSVTGRALLERRLVHLPDVMNDPEIAYRDSPRKGGALSALGVPILRDDAVVGLLAIGRTELRPFSDGEIAIAQSFADHAGIAMENVRLAKETRESLERQTAIADVLSAISTAATDVTPVFEAIIRHASRLCDADNTILWRRDGDEGVVLALYGASTPALPFAVGARAAIAAMLPARRVVAGEDVVHMPDLSADPEGATNRYALVSPTRLGVAIKIQGELYGWLNLTRGSVRPFTPHEIELVRTFAQQAAIAIENVRLFNETKTALERQTATSDVLKAISRSAFELQPVLETVIETAVRLTRADWGNVFRLEGEELRFVTASGKARPGYIDYTREHPLACDRASASGRAVLDGRTVHIPDVLADPDYTKREAQQLGAFRTVLAVPMLRDTTVVGVIAVDRDEVRPFTNEEIALIETFADQAAIAIENVRLFNETKESLERQTATSGVLEAISQARADVRPVLQTIVDEALRLCGADSAGFFRRDGDDTILEAIAGTWTERDVGGRRAFADSGFVNFAFTEKRSFNVPDMKSPDVWRLFKTTNTVAGLPDEAEWPRRITGPRSRLIVPVIQGGVVIGVIRVNREVPGGFSQRQVELIESFAAQAAIGIENVRLFNETKESLEQQTATTAVLQAISHAREDARAVLQTIVDKAQRLCAADSAGFFRRDGDNVVLEVVAGSWPAGHETPGQRVPFAEHGFVRMAFEDLRTFNVADMKAPEVWRLVKDRNPGGPAADYPDAESWANKIGAPRSRLVVPVIQDGAAIGVIRVHREQPGGFTQRQVELIESFAAQAAIGIENVRLFNETKAGLDRQTALADVLRAIAGSPTDVQPVLDTIAESAARFTGAEDVNIRLAENGELPVRSHWGQISLAGTERFEIDPKSIASTSFLERRTVHVSDILGPEGDQFPRSRERARAPGHRAMLIAPLIREGQPIGVIAARKSVPVAFTSDQVRLVETFADQAVIAIENVRLFNETKESLEQQTAIADILRVISASPADTQPVLDAIAASATKFAAAEDASVLLIRDGALIPVAHHGPIPMPLSVAVDRDSVSGRAIIEARTVHAVDVTADDEFPVSNRAGMDDGQRTVLAAPLIRDGTALGVIVMRRREPRAFTEQQLRLAQTFADQAAIAIENVRLFNETKESLERQTATSDVLRVISRSATDIKPVLDTVLSTASRLCEADTAIVFLRDGDALVVAAYLGDPETDEPRLGQRVSVAELETGERSGGLLGRVVRSRGVVHVPDVRDDPESAPLRAHLPHGQFRWRTSLGVPVLRENELVGVISLRRTLPRAFTERQIELVKTFADQAAIAIENVHLFNETNQSLERQTATTEILQVISSSPTDIQPVFDAIARSAGRYCAAENATVFLVEGDSFRPVASAGDLAIEPVARSLSGSYLQARVINERAALRVTDIQSSTEYPDGAETGKRLGFHALAVAPMIRGDRAIGTISLRRVAAEPFSDRQFELLQTFAAQAAIAVENVRLFNETKEALERQTATADVLRVISASPTDVQPVLDAIADRAMRLCAADGMVIRLLEGEELVVVARAGTLPALGQDPRIPLERDTLTGTAVLEARTMHVADVQTSSEYPRARDMATRGGHHTIAAIPLMREGRAIGVFSLSRQETRPYSEQELALVRTFADQAVIAIENVRLFNETKESLEQQTAVSEVLKTISRTVFDLVPTLQAVVDNAARLVDADIAWMTRGLADGSYAYAVDYGKTDELRGLFGTRPDARPHSQLTGSVMGDLYLKGETINRSDIHDEPELLERSPLAKRTGARSLVGVPVRGEGTVLGAFVVARVTVRPFTDREVQLVETFADQAAIAIKNVTLFNEIQRKSRELEVANRHKSEFLANMSHELRTPLNAIIGFSEVMLQGIFGALNDKQREYQEDVLSSGKHLLTLITDILDLSKIEAGRMELVLSTFALAPALESGLTIVRERASLHGITLQAIVPADLPPIEADERKVKQILFNLLSNAVKFTPDGGSVEVRARAEDGNVRVDVQDTGIGIAPEDHARVFEEFRQVGRERSREGTGLGLTLSKRFVELQGGRIWLESIPGKGSTFSFTLPLRRPAEVKA